MISVAVAVLAAAPIELLTLDCDEEASELRRIVASELANTPPLSIVRGSVECCPTYADVTLELSKHEYIGRVIELDAVPRALRARTIALAVVELAAAHQYDPEPLKIPSLPPLVHSLAPPETVEAPEPRRVGWAGITGYASMGVSTATLVIGVIYAVQALLEGDKLKNPDGGGGPIGIDQISGWDLARNAEAHRQFAGALIGTGVATAALGLTLVLFDGRISQITFAPSLAGGVALRGAF
jgi:hypothetical protein